jgi:hypothetical protein
MDIPENALEDISQSDCIPDSPVPG